MVANMTHSSETRLCETRSGERFPANNKIDVLFNRNNYVLFNRSNGVLFNRNNDVLLSSNTDVLFNRNNGVLCLLR